MELDFELKYNFYRIFNLITHSGMTRMEISMPQFLFLFLNVQRNQLTCYLKGELITEHTILI